MKPHAQRGQCACNCYGICSGGRADHETGRCKNTVAHGFRNGAIDRLVTSGSSAVIVRIKNLWATAWDQPFPLSMPRASTSNSAPRQLTREVENARHHAQHTSRSHAGSSQNLRTVLLPGIQRWKRRPAYYPVQRSRL